jgi:hypothetical protein
MQQLKKLFVPFVSLTSVSSIEALEYFRQMQPDIKFLGQSLIGVATLIYLAVKIRNAIKTKQNANN